MKKTKVLNLVTIVLMMVLLVLHFMPFWSFEGMSKSIQGYIWFPSSCTWLSEYLTIQLGESYSLNDIVLMPTIVLLITVLGIILCIWKWDNIFASLLPLVCGLAGIWGYLSKPAFQLGNNWGVHLAICIVMMIVAIMKIVFGIKKE